MTKDRDELYQKLAAAENYIQTLEQQNRSGVKPITPTTSYVNQQTSTELTQAQNQIRVLESERNQFRNELETARREINNFKQQQQSPSSTEQSLRIRTLESEFAQLRSSLQAATTTTPTTQVPVQNTIALQAQITQLKNQIESMKSKPTQSISQSTNVVPASSDNAKTL